jgi:hypothetical protein
MLPVFSNKHLNIVVDNVISISELISEQKDILPLWLEELPPLNPH